MVGSVFDTVSQEKAEEHPHGFLVWEAELTPALVTLHWIPQMTQGLCTGSPKEVRRLLSPGPLSNSVLAGHHGRESSQTSLPSPHERQIARPEQMVRVYSRHPKVANCPELVAVRWVDCYESRGEDVSVWTSGGT